MEQCLQSQNCGGCVYQGVSYEEQLKTKQSQVKGFLTEQGINSQIMSDIVPCPVRYNYRNKMDFAFGNETKDGELRLGLHKKSSFLSVFNTDCCQIVPEDFNVIQRAALDFCIERGYQHHNMKSHTGLLRHLVLRWGKRTGEILVNIVTTDSSEFDENAFKELVLGLKLDSKIVGVLHTINNNRSDAVICEKLNVLYGNDYYMEEILGLKFKVGAFSFFQTNVDAAERLYADALSLIDNVEGKTVFDLYCGTGTITQAMALKVKKAIGVEIVEDAVKSARANAELNGLSNCEFICGDVAEVLSNIKDKPDVIVVDPPRMGMSPKALKLIMSYGVDQVVYISCNPKTMADNLRAAALYGYKIKSLTPYDNFPFTKHIETVALLQK